MAEDFPPGQDGDVLLDQLPEGEPSRVPLRPTQLERFRQAVGKYHQQGAFSSDDVQQWEEWLDKQDARVHQECELCYTLTSTLRRNGTRTKDEGDVKAHKRAAFSKAESELVAHLRRWGQTIPTNAPTGDFHHRSPAFMRA